MKQRDYFKKKQINYFDKSDNRSWFTSSNPENINDLSEGVKSQVDGIFESDNAKTGQSDYFNGSDSSAGAKDDFFDDSIPRPIGNKSSTSEAGGQKDEAGGSIRGSRLGRSPFVSYKEGVGVKGEYSKKFSSSVKKSAKKTANYTHAAFARLNESAQGAAQDQIGKKDYLDTDDDIKNTSNRLKGGYQNYRKVEGGLAKAKASTAKRAANKSNRASRKVQKKIIKRRQYAAAQTGARRSLISVLKSKLKRLGVLVAQKAKAALVGMFGGLVGIVVVILLIIIILLLPLLFFTSTYSTGLPIAFAAMDIALVDRVTTSGTREFPPPDMINSPEAANFRRAISETGITPPFASCCRAAAAAIRWSVDPNFPGASSQTQREYMVDVDHFDFVGIWTEMGSRGMMPGDILVTNHDRDAGDPGHIMIYVGNDLVQTVWPGSPSNIYDGSLGGAGSGGRLPAVVFHVPHIFREEIPPIICGQCNCGTVLKEGRPEIVYYVFRFNGNL